MPLLNDSNFEQNIRSGFSLVNFSSLWNMESRAFEDSLRKLSEEFRGRVKFIVSDVNANSELAKKEGITKIPTMVIYFNGVAVARLNSFTKRQAREALEYVLGKYGSA